VIDHNRIAAARCILPLSQNNALAPDLGLRHRAGLGLAEGSDALVIVISEERNEISIVKEGKLRRDVDVITLERALRDHFNPNRAAQ
jgi:diadenylate cyclase